MTRESVSSDVLILPPSLARRPDAPVSRTDSEPARSTRDSAPTSTPLASSSRTLDSTTMRKTVWLRDDRSFIAVAPTARARSPRTRASAMLDASTTTSSCAPSM